MNYVERADTYAHSPFVDVVVITTYNITPGSFQRVQFDGILTNEMGCWSATNKWFECPKAGRLQIHTALCTEMKEAYVTGAIVSELKVANSGGSVYRTRRFGQYNDLQAGVASLLGSTIVNVNYGDKVWLEFLSIKNAIVYGTTDLGGVEGSFMSLNYVT